MHVELAEFLRCPRGHERAVPCVVSVSVMVGREVREGTVGCPVCRAEYPVEHGAVRFGDPPSAAPGAVAVPAGVTADGLQALLGIGGPGGYVVLVGAACRLAPELSSTMPGVHLVGVNPPPDAPSSAILSVLYATHKIPLQTAVARGAVVGGDAAAGDWPAEAARVVLRGLRVVVFGRDVAAGGLERLAEAGGVWVGQKR